ncbi:MAG: DEAD/DEAH box helicase family protein [Gemmataceae bacterium]
MSDTPIEITFEDGTLALRGGTAELLAALPGSRFDPRTNVYRAEARMYRAIVEGLIAQKVPYHDAARAYEKTPWPLRTSRDPFPHQRESVQTWWQTGGRGVVVLPTGTGKTFVAILAIHPRPAGMRVVTPTIDLMSQWYSEREVAFDVELGGGYRIQPLTVSTHDSAHLHLERWGRSSS